MDDLAERLDLIIAVVEGARAMPLTTSCVLNRAEMLEALEDLRARLPERLADADRVLADSEAIIDDAHRRAAAIVADGRREGVRLASGSAVVAQAETDAAAIMAAARQASDDMRSQIDSYVDGKLAGFEEVLDRTLASVARGRERLASRGAVAGAAGAHGGAGGPAGPHQFGGVGPAAAAPMGARSAVVGAGGADLHPAVSGAGPAGPDTGVPGGGGPHGDPVHGGGWYGGAMYGDRTSGGGLRGDGMHGGAGMDPAGGNAAGGGVTGDDAAGGAGPLNAAAAPGQRADPDRPEDGERWTGVPAARGGMTGHVRLTSGVGAPIG
ncbi:ATP synthase subunit B family protein [Parafrankia discariae]|uniref:hypothetical protein n=1 Tax=Parafrankia discariae TaxID=365528 RepID=UPI0003817D8D|nr:hypothetical protein [Parafrankia discariae]